MQLTINYFLNSITVAAHGPDALYNQATTQILADEINSKGGNVTKNDFLF